MIFFKQLLLLVFCVLGVLHGQLQINSVAYHNELISDILKYLNERNPSYLYKSGNIVQSFLKGNKLEATSDIEVTCEFPCTGGIVRCESIFQSVSEEPVWRVAGTICAPKEPENEEENKYLPPMPENRQAFYPEGNNGHYVSEQQKQMDVAAEPKIVEENVVKQQKASTMLHDSVESTQNTQHVHCAGCPVDIDPQAEGVNLLVNAALKHIESERNEKHVVMNVLRVQQQVIAGIKYILLVEFAPTICQKNINELSCPVDQTKDTFTCEIEYVEQAWLAVSEIVKNNCTSGQTYKLPQLINTTEKPANREMELDFLSDLESQIGTDTDVVEPVQAKQVQTGDNAVPNQNTQSVHCTGCPLDINPHAEGIDILVNAALEHIESERNEKHVAINVLRVQQQVVAGIKYNILIEVAPTVCEKNTNKPSCPVDKTKDSFVCEVEYLEQAWLGLSEIIRNNCTTYQYYTLRQLINTTKKPVNRELEPDFMSELESQILTDMEPVEVQYPYSTNEINPVYSNANEIPELIVLKRKTREIEQRVIDEQKPVEEQQEEQKPIQEEHTVLKRKSHKHDDDDDDDDDSSSSSDSDDHHKKHKKHKKHHSDDSDDDSDDHKHKHKKSKKKDCDSDEHKHKHNKHKKHNKHDDDSDDDSDSSNSSDSSSSSDSSDHKKHKHKHDHRKKRSNEVLNSLSEDDQSIVEKLSKVIGKQLDYQNYEVVGVSKINLDKSHYKFEILAEKNHHVVECSVNVALDNDDILKSTVYANSCNGKGGGKSKRDVEKLPVLGGVREGSVDDPRIKPFLNDGLLHMDKTSPHKNKYKVQEVLKVTKQVISGLLWQIEAKVAVSDCEKEKSTDLENCGIPEDSPTKICKFKIVEQLWKHPPRKTKITCENESQEYSFRRRRSIPGGIEESSVDDPRIKPLLKDGLLHMDKTSPHENKYKVKKVVASSKQVVSGLLWRIKVEVAVSDCQKGKSDDLEKCGILQDVPTKICDFKVWEQPWLNPPKQTNITCENESKEYSFRRRRSIIGDDDELFYSEVFEHFLARYDKKYLNMMEHDYRLQVFKNNVKLIHLLNKYEQGTAVYRITQFADMTTEEFSKRHGLRMDLQNENDVPFREAEIPDIELPTSFDWRNNNAVTEVKDQGMCGSCWAFSTTGNVEGQYAIKYKDLKEFSEQELVDCDKLDEGCNGGLMDNAYRTIERLGGLELENEYPYEAEDEKCHFNKTKVVVRLSGALNISQDEGDMAKWLTKNGPISIAINANAMQFYAGGVSHPLKFLCNPTSLDHGVLIVGYGVHTSSILKKTVPYWIVKNSWGKSWGEHGYYRVYRGDGTCGVNQTPSSAVVA